MQLLGRSKRDIEQNKNGEILSTVVALVHCNLVNNDYQQASKVLFSFVPNKKISQLITITSHSLAMLKKLMQNFHLLKFGSQVNIIDHLE